MLIRIETTLDLLDARERNLLQGILDAYNAVGQTNTQKEGKDWILSKPIPPLESFVPKDLDSASGDPKVPSVVTVYTSDGNEELAKSHLNVNDTVDRVDVRLADEGADKRKRTRKPRKDKGKSRTPKSEEGDPNPCKDIVLKDGTKVGHLDTCTGEAVGDVVRDPNITTASSRAAHNQRALGRDLSAVQEKIAAIKERQEMREIADLALSKKIAKKAMESIEPKDFTKPTIDPKEVVEAVVNVKTEKIDMESSIDDALTALDSEKTEGESSSKEQRTRLRELRVEAGKLDIFSNFRQIVVDECGQVMKFVEISHEVAGRIIPKIEQLISDAQEGKVTK